MRRGAAVAICLALIPPTGPAAAQDSGDLTALVAQGPAPPAGDDLPPWPVSARLSGPTDRYGHDVLGGVPHFSQLEVTARACSACRHGWESAVAYLPEDMVFEDVALRLWDVTGDARPEIVVAEAHVAQGARLAVWSYSGAPSGTGQLTRLATTDFIGQPDRWLAIAGHSDFDGDGRIEIAYVDRPHLVQDLVFVRIEGRALTEIARLPGLTNHKIGETVLSSGVRDCGAGAEVVLHSPDRRRMMAATPAGARDIGRFSPAALAGALACRQTATP